MEHPATLSADLSAALDALLAAAAAAVHDLPNDDTTAVAVQAQKAKALLDDMRDAMASANTEHIFHVLHGLNNKLTGALTLMMLAREDLAPKHPADQALALVVARARAATDLVRAVAEAIKARPSVT